MKLLAFLAMGLVAALVSGCQCTSPCTPPVRECLDASLLGDRCQAEPVMEYKQACPPQSYTQTTVIRRDAACSAPVGEIAVTRSRCVPRKMVFVSVRPSDDRCYNPESRNFERPWPWGPNNIGSCSPCR